MIISSRFHDTAPCKLDQDAMRGCRLPRTITLWHRIRLELLVPNLKLVRLRLTCCQQDAQMACSICKCEPIKVLIVRLVLSTQLLKPFCMAQSCDMYSTSCCQITGTDLGARYHCWPNRGKLAVTSSHSTTPKLYISALADTKPALPLSVSTACLQRAHK